MLTEKEILGILEDTQALLTGHFKLSSGRHSEKYTQCAQVLQYPDQAELLAKALAEKCRENIGAIDVVASPAVGGLVLGQEMARALGVRSVFSERDHNGEMTLRRSFRLNENEKVLMVDDVFTTGKSLRELLKVVKAQGAQAVGAASLAERGLLGNDFEVPLISLIKLDFADYDPSDCPACQKGLPVIKPGSRPQ